MVTRTFQRKGYLLSGTRLDVLNREHQRVLNQIAYFQFPRREVYFRLAVMRNVEEFIVWCDKGIEFVPIQQTAF